MRSLRNLDESGIVYVGAEVKPGDIFGLESHLKVKLLLALKKSVKINVVKSYRCRGLPSSKLHPEAQVLIDVRFLIDMV